MWWPPSARSSPPPIRSHRSKHRRAGRSARATAASRSTPRVADLGVARWERLFPAPGWKDRHYYQTLEETLTAQGFDQGYLLLSDASGEPWAIQPLFFVRQDLTVSLPVPLRRAAGWLRRRCWTGFATTRMLMAGCVVGEWQCGAGDQPDWDRLTPALDAALEVAARRARVSLILWKDVPSEFRAALAPLRRKGGYARFPSPPGVRLRLDCASFEEFLATRLGKSTRKSLRRKFRDVEERTAGEPVTMEVRNELTEAEATELHGLYETVARRGEVQFEVFPKEYFLRLSRRMPGMAHSFLWRWRGVVVAFAFCMVADDTLFDNDLGLDYRHAHDLHLYHLTFRDLYDWAVTRGLKFYASSPSNYAPKLHLQMELSPRDVYARHRWGFAQAILRRVAPRLEPTRQEPLLREFPNASEVTDPR